MKLFLCRGAAVLAAAYSIAFSVAAGAAEPTFYRFQKLAEGVYAAITPHGMGAINCNVLVVVGDEEVLLVDGAAEAESVKRLLADIKTLTDKPVRYVVNTHFHFDHAGGNDAFGPEVKIISSEYTAQRLATHPRDGRTFQRFYGSGENGITGLQQQGLNTFKGILARETDPAKLGGLRERIAAIEGQIAAMKMTVARVPNVVVKDKLVLPRAAGEVQVLNVGRGHTGGDVVVYLPREGIVATGDLLHEFLAYMGDAYLDDWPNAIEKVKQLKFDRVVGGHGAVLPGLAKLTAFQAYLRDFAGQAASLKKQGVSAEDAPKKMDLSSHAGAYPQAATPPSVFGVIRYYELLDGKDVR